MLPMSLSLTPVAAEDFEAMLALRVEALRESLERLGRFDPQRARERLASQFEPACMQHIERDGQRIGFVTVKPLADGALKLEHLYLRPGSQGEGVGRWVLDGVKRQGRDIHLAALKHSDANRFYLREGFVPVGESDVDIDYRWKAGAA
ncbi:GNAT family N-acetyltransferase [Pelomonas sp. APW6]|uniref:GNAT family N-acetyltransferase n=2 Tax=Roseateles subflavus TaxID=3053353 RepID=A0ABT7LME1_9BURK|nr:GNAT family N-acetyltransferase [Pelomonas sp. APW6]MDL5034036.1 GNAT family N-acetyltransferase [Pelomonas sp. APW6]